MFTEFTPQQNPVNSPLFNANIPDQMVMSAIDAIIARMAPDYLELMRESRDKPEIISDYKASLYDFGKELNRDLSYEDMATVREAQKLAPNCKVVTKWP